MPHPPYGIGDASFRAAGGESGLLALCERFYALMARREDAATIHAMHRRDAAESAARLAAFLCGWLGGPPRYRERYAATGIDIPRFHQRFAIGEAERDAWLSCMAQAVAERDWAEDFKDYLLRQLRFPAEACRRH